MAQSKHSKSYPSAAHAIFLVSVWLINLPSTTAKPSSSSWHTPLRIGIQSSLSHHRSKRGKLLSQLAVNSPSSQLQEYWLETTEQESIYDEAEWNALFEGEEEDGPNKAICASRKTTSIRPRNDFEESWGFRQTLQLPAFLAREKTIVAYNNVYDDDDIVPCAAISVSSKVKGASFSAGMQQQQQSVPRREATLNLRKDPSRPRFTQSQTSTKNAKGRPLVFWENMICGAISRSVAQTIMHPANTMKTLLQQSNSQPIAAYMKPSALPLLFRGAGANFVLSVPHGAINFAVLETVRNELSRLVKRTNINEEKFGPALDFTSSALSTICTSVVSTPQMMITDNIMAGNYKNLPDAIRGLASRGGLKGFYARGWWPGLVGKIPSYALTWTFFQQLKVAQYKLSGRQATNFENTIMGCVASGTTVCIMIPMDTIKTRLVTQATNGAAIPYKGIIDCAIRVAREEGIKAFYKGLPPRLVSVVPMIGIQFTVYEAMKRVMQKRQVAEQRMQHQKPAMAAKKQQTGKKKRIEAEFDPYSSMEVLQESCMEVAASPEHPYPAPHFSRTLEKKEKKQWGWLRQDKK